VRLIRAFSISTTFWGALALTVGSLPIALLHALVFGSRLQWYPLSMALTGLVGFLVAHYVLRLKRLRGRISAAIGTAILSGPWPVYLDLLAR
jgi:hypothetical protein